MTRECLIRRESQDYMKTYPYRHWDGDPPLVPKRGPEGCALHKVLLPTSLEPLSQPHSASAQPGNPLAALRVDRSESPKLLAECRMRKAECAAGVDLTLAWLEMSFATVRSWLSEHGLAQPGPQAAYWGPWKLIIVCFLRAAGIECCVLAVRCGPKTNNETLPGDRLTSAAHACGVRAGWWRSQPRTENSTRVTQPLACFARRRFHPLEPPGVVRVG